MYPEKTMSLAIKNPGVPCFVLQTTGNLSENHFLIVTKIIRKYSHRLTFILLIFIVYNDKIIILMPP